MNSQIRPVLTFAVIYMLSVMTLRVSCKITKTFYQKRTVCDVQRKIQIGCMELASTARISDIHCVRLCQQRSSICMGIVLSNTGSCYCRYDCGFIEDTAVCTAHDDAYHGYDRESSNEDFTCKNGQIRRGTTDTCDCDPYWKGESCDRRLTSCQELRTLGYSHGIHWVDMNVMGRPSVSKVKCSIGPMNVQTYLSHNDGESDFNATFQEYKDGFHTGNTSFWLGLDNMRALTLAGLVYLEFRVYIRGVKVFSVYQNIVVESEAQNYAFDYGVITLGRNALNLDIGYQFLKRAQFSAWDKDNDLEDSMNLAALTGTGWWYGKSNANFGNFNGKRPEATPKRFIDLSIDGIDMSYNAYGKDFDHTEVCFQQYMP